MTEQVGCGGGPVEDIDVLELAERVVEGLPVSIAAHRDIAAALIKAWTWRTDDPPRSPNGLGPVCLVTLPIGLDDRPAIAVARFDALTGSWHSLRGEVCDRVVAWMPAPDPVDLPMPRWGDQRRWR